MNAGAAATLPAGQADDALAEEIAAAAARIYGPDLDEALLVLSRSPYLGEPG